MFTPKLAWGGGLFWAAAVAAFFAIPPSAQAQVLASNLKFTPIAPCRVADTRNPGYGGVISTGSFRVISLAGVCGLPSTAKAYALNLTLVPVSGAAIQSVALMPSGYTNGGTTVTISNPNARLRANNAIIAAGNQNAIDIRVAAQTAPATTHAFIDVNGYFSESSPYVYYPVFPCRVADTRLGSGQMLGANSPRTFPVAGSCGVPTSAKAFVLNFTMVPPGAVGYLTVYPTGGPQPVVSTMNNLNGFILANGAIAPAGQSGQIDLYTTDATHMIIDVSGYFDLPGGPSSASTLTVINPCRAASATVTNTPYSLTSCAPPTSTGYTMNATLQPSLAVGFLTVWPYSLGSQPTVSLLNAIENEIVSNGLIAAAGSGGQLSAYINGGAATLSFDLTGYFTSVSSGGGSTTPSYQGSVTSANCTSVNGWVMDATSPASSVNVSVYVDGTYVGTELANQYNPNSATHGFSFNRNLTAGTHSVTVRVGGWNAQSSPQSVACGSSAGPALPTRWKGTNYHPRNSSWWAMLRDWNSVRSSVLGDLDVLSANGFNLVHLYLYDNGSFGNSDNASAGIPYPDPSANPGPMLLTNLADFLVQLRSRNIYAAIHFVSLPFRLNTPGLYNPENNTAFDTAIQNYANWTSAIIEFLHSNSVLDRVLMWGLNWQQEPGGDVTNPYSIIWKKIYLALEEKARSRTPSDGLGLIGVEVVRFGADINTGPLPRQSGFNWSVQSTLNNIALMRSLLGNRDPDLYLLQLYNGNNTDLRNALLSLINSPGGIDASRILVHEFGGSSSRPDSWTVDSVPVLGVGDKQVPFMTVADFNQWYRNTLCTFNAAGIQKTANWTRFDMKSYWASPPWNSTTAELAWTGHWGLGFEQVSGGEKSAWSTMLSYFNSTLNCPGTPVPIVALQTPEEYYTVGQDAEIGWSAADFIGGLQFGSGGAGVSIAGSALACGSNQEVSSILDLTCGKAFTSAFPWQGNFNLSLTAPNSTVSSSTNVTVGSAPVLTSVVNANSGAISPVSTIRVTGKGFEPNQSWVWVYNSAGTWVLFSVSDFGTQTHRLLEVNLANRLAPGAWNIQLWNGFPVGNSQPSNAIQFSVQ